MNIGKLKRSTQIAIMTGAGSGAVEKTANGTSPLTLSDSVAGNIHSITVKGHSEFVDGAIKSIGDAGWGVVDLGTLTWTYESEYSYVQRFSSSAIPNIKLPNTQDDIPNLICRYKPRANGTDGLGYWMPYSITCGYAGNRRVDLLVPKDITTVEQLMNYIGNNNLLYYPLADTTGATPTFGITSKNGAGQGTAATITTGLPLRSVSDSIYDTLDNEKVTKKCAEVDLGDLTWEYTQSRFQAQLSGSSIISGGVDAICNNYTLYKGSLVGFAETDDSFNVGNLQLSSNPYVLIRDSSYTDATTFKTAVTGVKLVYPLATPTETLLTSAETTALSALETYDPTTVISITDNPSITVKYMGKRAARTAPKKRTNRKKKS